MPVLSIPQLETLIGAGNIDGRVAAVGGYWLPAMVPSCPAPNRWYAPIEHYCGYDVFSDPGFEIVTCRNFTGGTECGGNTPPPGTTYITPALIDDDANGYQLREASVSGKDPHGTPAVLIGHVADARLYQCPSEARADCKKAFVIDRVAWLGGVSLEAGLPIQTALQLKMSLQDVATAAGSQVVLTAVPALAKDAVTLDPRLQAVGNSVVWVVRSLRTQDGSGGSDPARAVDVWLVDDATAAVSQHMGLEVDRAYNPAFVHVQAAARGTEPNSGLTAFYTIKTPDGRGVIEQIVGGGGWSQGGDSGDTTFGAGMPAVIDAGQYDVTAWLAPYGNPDQHSASCTKNVRVLAATTPRMEAAFDADGTCKWRDPTFPESLY